MYAGAKDLSSALALPNDVEIRNARRRARIAVKRLALEAMAAPDYLPGIVLHTATSQAPTSITATATQIAIVEVHIAIRIQPR